MHKILAVILSQILVVAPVYGQAAASTTPDALDRVFQFIRDVGAPWSLILLIVFVVYRLGKPGAEAFVENSRARTESEKATRSALESSGKAQTDSASALTKVANAMVDLANVNKQTMERMAEFEKSSDATRARKEAVVAINDHTDDAIKPLDGKLKTVAETLEELKRDVVTKQVLTDTIDPLVRKIDAALQVIHDLQQANDTPAPEAPAERANMVEVDAKQE